MADVVVLGAGVAGHTAALHLKRLLRNEHTVTVVTPNSQWNWIPSNIWVGVGDMPAEKVLFPLADVYRKKKINYLQAKAVAIHPDGGETDPRPFVDIEYTGQGRAGQAGTVHYDYLINATGPKLRFEATAGMGPGGFTQSVCTADHATHAAQALETCIAKMKAGEPQTLVIGMGHGTCTCQGAAFEYVFNVDHTIRQAGVRDLATIVYLTNEAALGDFGVGGLVFDQEGFQTNSELWTKSLFRERGVLAVVGAHVERVEDGVIHYETIDGTKHSIAFDFSMLIPPFGGVGLKAYARDGSDVSDKLFAPSGFMKVDADYTPKPYADWKATDWPSTYEVPGYRNIFAVGIAFAPPHAISKPLKTPNGTPIAPAPPRTGMPSGVTGKAAAITIARRLKNPDAPAEHASMAHMGAACVASAGTGLTKGSAAAMTMLPVVPDYDRYPTGRDVRETRGELGLHGHWVKLMLHHLFLYKAKAKFGWPLIPE